MLFAKLSALSYLAASGFLYACWQLRSSHADSPNDPHQIQFPVVGSGPDGDRLGDEVVTKEDQTSRGA